MPAVRGFTFSYEGTTTDAGLVIPVCANQQNDLLIAVCQCDTGSLTTFTATPPTGWNILQEWYNTTPLIAYFKLAGASEADLTIAATTHATTNETYNGSMTAFRDVDQSTPVGRTSLSTYSQTNQDTLVAIGDGTTTGLAQSFASPAATTNTNARGCFHSARFYMRKVGTPTGNATAKLYAHSGTLGSSSVPTGTALATSNNFDVSTLTGTLAWVDFFFPPASGLWYQFAASTNYCIAIEYSGGDASNYIQVGVDASSPGHAGNVATYASSTWTANAAQDACFNAYRFSWNMANLAAAARNAMPTITTERNNAMVLYLGGSSGSAGTPSFIEGPVTQIHGSDGAAESHCMGWTLQPTAGTTPATVYCSTSVTGATVLGVGEIYPPLAGATAVPTYCAADLCTYIDPIAGTTAYNSNTALAATADTNFGTSLGGFTANDATVAAMTDAGINSFHSLGGMTNAAVAGTVSGAELVLAAANRFNFSSKNLLAHAYFASPAHTQRHAPVASNRGTWMGARSNTGSGGATTGYKIWQVHGIGTPWDNMAHVPILINNGAGNTKATSGTLDASVIASVGFWVSGIGILTAQVGFGSLWLMDTTTVAGGSSAEPMDITGIVRAVATGKERVSAILQGAKQMLSLQSIQIGDGGTNPVYLDLDGTAIEFPKQYSQASGQVNYNSTDNKIGLSYYAGASDTIKHRNSVISAPNRYTWGLHASSSTAASYDFSGLSVIGAGTISLARAITITGLTINDYSTLDASGLTLTGSTIKAPPSGNDSLTTNASTSISNSNINVSTVASGNRWCSVASPSIFSACAFTGGGGHAIRITSPGTYSLSACTFTGFGADGSNGAAIYNDSGGSVTINITGGGSTPTIRNGTGASTTVNNNKVLTLTGLQTGSDIVILTAGTTTERVNVDAHGSTSYAFSYAYQASDYVDICVYKHGYVPFAVRNYLLPNADGSLPIAQIADRNYSNP